MKLNKFKRNYQLANTFLLLAVIILSTFFLSAFDVDVFFLKFMQWFLIAFFFLFALFEYLIPFAVIDDKGIIVREYFFKKKFIPKDTILKIKNYKNRHVVLFMKNTYDRNIPLKTINIKQKNIFLKKLSSIAMHNRRIQPVLDNH